MTQAEVGKFLLQLYQGSKELPIQTFRQWALTQLAVLIPFDWACWRYGLMEADACHIHGEVHYQAPDLPNALFKPADSLPQRFAITRPDQVLNLAAVNPSDKESVRSAASAGRRGASHPNRPRPVLYTDISLYRNGQIFTKQQRKDAEVLGAHVGEAWLIKLRLHVNNDRGPLQPVCEKALCDARGTIWWAHPQFDELLRQEWPKWQGHHLPQELDKIVGDGDGAYDGRQLRCTALRGPTSDLIYLQVQRQPPLLSLPPRQRRIAIELAQGKTYNQIAHNLGISRSTVTNHANAIYSKLGISNKVQLTLLCFGNTLHSLVM